MKRIWGLILCVLIALVYQVSLADQIAITEEGRKVLLKDDGTWEYVKEKSNGNEAGTSGNEEKTDVTTGNEGSPIGEKDLFAYRPIDSWTGEDFVFLPTGKAYKLLKAGEDYDLRDIDTWYTILPYKQYVGRIAKAIAVERKELPSGYDWIVEFEMKDNKEKLVIKAQGQTINSISPISDIDNARKKWINKTILVKNRYPGANPFGIELRAHNKNPYEPVTFHAMRYTPLTVIDVVAGSSNDRPVRFILKTAKGKEGHLDVDMSGTNATKIGAYRFEEFFFIENLREKYDWPDSIWDSIQLGKVSIGMSNEQILLSWGEPIKKNITISENNKHEQWIYEADQYLYFVNGLLTGLQYSKQ